MRRDGARLGSDYDTEERAAVTAPLYGVQIPPDPRHLPWSDWLKALNGYERTNERTSHFRTGTKRETATRTEPSRILPGLLPFLAASAGG